MQLRFCLHSLMVYIDADTIHSTKFWSELYKTHTYENMYAFHTRKMRNVTEVFCLIHSQDKIL